MSLLRVYTLLPHQAHYFDLSHIFQIYSRLKPLFVIHYSQPNDQVSALLTFGDYKLSKTT